jgi:hypothetical protein
MSKCDEYRATAADCMKLAAVVNDPTARLVFLTMAGAWLRLADRVALNHRAPNASVSRVSE